MRRSEMIQFLKWSIQRNLKLTTEINSNDVSNILNEIEIVGMSPPLNENFTFEDLHLGLSPYEWEPELRLIKNE